MRNDVKPIPDLRKTILKKKKNVFKRLAQKVKSIIKPSEYSRGNCCWNCKRVGHKRNECREPCTCRKQLRDPEVNHEEIIRPLKQLRLIKIGTGYGFRLDVRILTREFTAIVDTGATTTYVGTTIVELCKHFNIEPKKCTNAIVFLVNNTVGEATEAYDLPMQIGVKELRTEAVVLEGLTDEVILGGTALKLFGFQLTFGGHTIDENSPFEETPEPILKAL